VKHRWFSRPEATGSPFDLLRPGSLHNSRVFGGWFVKARQQFGGDIGAFVRWKGQRFTE
jgi:hypothetical protein